MLASAGGAEAAERFLGVGEDLAAAEPALAEGPDPGDRDVADPEGAAAGVDPAPHEQGVAVALGHLGRDQQLVPDLLDVAQVLLQAARADVGGGAPHLLGGAGGEEPHLLVAELADLLAVAPVEGRVEALDQ